VSVQRALRRRLAKEARLNERKKIGPIQPRKVAPGPTAIGVGAGQGVFIRNVKITNFEKAIVADGTRDFEVSESTFANNRVDVELRNVKRARITRNRSE